MAKKQTVLHDRLFDWMGSENDALASGVSQLPVGSYSDGRPRTEQHDHDYDKPLSAKG